MRTLSLQGKLLEDKAAELEEREEEAAAILAKQQMADGYGSSWKRQPGEYGEFGANPLDGRVTGDMSWLFLRQQGRPKVAASSNTKGTVTTTIPASSSRAPRAPRIYSKKLKNKGWNSWARSIDPLVAGDYYLFTASQGLEAALLGIAPLGWEGRNIARFTHSIIVDHRGIKIYESGVLAETLKGTQLASSLIRIHRQADNTIVYVVTTGVETLVHTSTEALTYYVGTNLYVYGMLYSADDRVTSSALETGSVQYGSV